MRNIDFRCDNLSAGFIRSTLISHSEGRGMMCRPIQDIQNGKLLCSDIGYGKDTDGMSILLISYRIYPSYAGVYNIGLV